MDKIILNFKDATLKEMPLAKDITTIGRKPDNDIVIDNLAVSGHHARIVKEGMGIFIEDLNSLNGTFINDKRIAKSGLRNKDKIVIGKHSIVFLSDRPEAQAAEEPAKKASDSDKTMVLDTKARAAMGGTQTVEAIGMGGFSVVEGESEMREYELKDRLIMIGKADNSQIKLKGLLAPKVAALVNRTKDGYFIAPPGEGGKVKVNGTPLTGRAKLKEGDIVEVHNIKLQFFMKA